MSGWPVETLTTQGTPIRIGRETTRPTKPSTCGFKPIGLAQELVLTGRYERENTNDWLELCQLCHNHYDRDKRLTPKQRELRDTVKTCLTCRNEFRKNKQQSYKQWDEQRFCTRACRRKV